MPTPPDQPNDPGTSDPVPEDPQDAKLDRLATALEGLVEGLNKRQEREEESAEKSKKRAATARKNATMSNDGFLKELGNKLSLALPGGARLFGLGTLMDKFKQFDDRAKKSYGGADKLTPFGAAIRKLTLGMGAAAAAAYALSEGLYALGKQLGGVTGGQALQNAIGSVRTMIGIGEDGTPRLRSPTRTIQTQGAAAQEFGVLIESQTAALLGDIATDLGLSTRELISLERVFQSSTISSEEAINKFKSVGIVAGVAQKELMKNTEAVARAGDQFNTYIVASIANAKRLGLEFKNMDSTLTGYTMDFEGTIGKFAELRAVLPEFQVDFGQLMSVAMTGTTDEFIEIIRGGMMGAGLSPNDPRNRMVAKLLKDATGFSSDQVDRILGNETPFQDATQVLDQKRNTLLKLQLGILGGMFGMIVSTLGVLSSLASLAMMFIPGGPTGKAAAMAGKSVLRRAAPSALRTGLKVGAGAGAGIALAAHLQPTDAELSQLGESVNDAYITKKGEVHHINPNDNALFTQQSPFGSNNSVEKKLDKIASLLGSLVGNSRAEKTVTMKGFTEAIETIQAAAIHEGY